MSKTIYFHIGSMKTGSTGIQKFCYEQREKLLGHDVDYVQFEPPQLHLPRWANADVLLNPDFDTAYVSSMIEASPASKIVISEEGLIGRPWVWQHPVFNQYERKIILYLRNSVDLVASWASENSLPYNFRQASHSSGRGVVSIDEGIGIWTNSYRGMLFGLVNAFTTDPGLEVRIRRFPTVDGTDLMSDFLAQLDLSEAEVSELNPSTENAVVNEGKDRKYCDIAYLVSQLAIEYELEAFYRLELVNEIYRRVQSGDVRKVVYTVSDIEKHYIKNRISPALSELNEMYGGLDEVGEIPAVPPTSRGPYSRVDAAELRTIFLEEIVRILHQKSKA